MNYEKSVTYCSLNVGEEKRRMILDCLGVCVSSDPEQYLSLPNIVGRNKVGFFNG